MKRQKQFAEWSTKEINDLPDNAFAYIEDGGTKDKDGKTAPRSKRHLPYKGPDGKVDLPHVRNALARLESTEIPEDAKAGIKSKLEGLLDKAKASEKLVGVFPFEFDETGDDAASGAAIPDTIHLIPIGTWDHYLYGPIIITAADIAEFKKNFDAGIRNGVPITAGHESMSELPAVGWITQVEARDTGLWGMVEWNEEGKALLSDKAFKFFSPEFYQEYADPESHEVTKNVLVGGALTKSPYFKELEAVVFSEPKIIKKFNETMDLKELLTKKPEELSDAEKSFVKEHAADLTAEQKEAFKTVVAEAPAETEAEKAARVEKETGDANEAAGKNRDGSEKKVEGSDKKMITMSELEVNTLRAAADKGALAFAELQKGKIDTATNALVFSESNKGGKFLPKSKDNLAKFMESLTDAQRVTFTTLIAELPKTQLFSEVGHGAGAAEGTAQAEVEAKIAVKIEASAKNGAKAMTYSEALKQVMSENEGLEQRYDSELPKARGGKQ